jgi:superfamily II DNA or RNA helicase
MHIVIDLDSVRDKGIIKSDSLDMIREFFSEADPKASLMKNLYKSKARFIPSRKYAITEAGRFELGLLVDIINYIKSLNAPFRIIFSEQFKARYLSAYPFAEEPLTKLSLELYDFQRIGVVKALKNGNGLLIEPTGAGKTLMQGTIIATVMAHKPESRVLLITLTHLIDQIYNELVSYGIDPINISRWSGGHELDRSKSIVICGPNILYSKIDNVELEMKKVKIIFLTMKKTYDTDQSLSPAAKSKLQLQMREAKDKLESLEVKLTENKVIHNFLGEIDLLIADEIHSWKKDGEITNVLKYINTRNRFGFTGTLPEMKIDQWSIIGHFGPIVHESKREQLVADKHISDTDVRIILLEHKSPPNFKPPHISEREEDETSTEYYERELEYIHHNVFRNNVIKKIADKTAKNTLILIDRLEHGDYLYEFLKSNLPNKEVYYIKGEVEDEERSKITALMEKQDNVVCIAMSRIFSTGVNIKNLHYIVFTSAGKAKVKNIQSIGRGVRKLEGKIKVVIFDLCDNLFYSMRHLDQRTKVYDNDQISYQITKIKEST